MDNNTGEMTAEQFFKQYIPLNFEDGDVSCTYGQAVQYPIEHVWTITEEDGNLYVGAGFHVVNRINYVVTEKPWETGSEVAEWWIVEEYDEDDDEEDSYGWPE